LPQAWRVTGGGEGIESLDEAECRALLGDRGIGRVAVSIGAVPSVVPVNYIVLDGAVVFRTGSGTKLDAAVRRSVVAFEVDDIDPIYHEGWSVLVVGMADELTDPDMLARAEHLPLLPWAPGPHEHVVTIHPEIVTGRRIVQGRTG
jgi:nitroimidazol reductase NimA-like FMN-containing flavoprotein (pyridoxamine 5'-phosphate oxidase superfamily)